jgi:pyruvate/2-oxoglutarate dehydrogenase complex dihydrolipoamide acyltransferase (E2) component
LPKATPVSHMNNGGDAVQTDWVTTPSDLLVRYDVVNIAMLGECMDTRTILADLKAELNCLNQAIAALESLDGTATAMPRATTPTTKAAPTQAKKRGLTPAGRRRLSAMMKARRAARRKAAAKPAPKKASGRRTMSAAARKKIAEAQRKRWAAVRKAAKKPGKKTKAGKILAKKAEQGSSGAGVMDLLKSVFQ